MFRKSIRTISAVTALSFPTAQALYADETPVAAPAPAAAAAPAPKGQLLLQAVLDDLTQGKSDFAPMEPMLKVNLMQRAGLIPSLSARLQGLGALQTVTFAGVQNGVEVYDVRFANGSSMWTVTVAPDGKLTHISWRFQ